jgi:hypothetical protein
MNVRQLLCAHLTLLVLTLTGCTDAGKCERGLEDCACLDDECASGLSCVDDVCVDNGGGGDGDGDGDGDGEPRDAGPTPDVDCDGDSVRDVCDQFCEVFCYNQIRFCGASECLPEDCEEAGIVLDACLGCDNLSCATQLCRDQIDPEYACNDYGTEKTIEGVRTFQTFCLDRDPLCVQHSEIGCSDVCGSDSNNTNADYVDNGVCEDGHAEAQSSACDRGTDCTDCEPHPCGQAGADCVNHGDCCGFYGVGALCVDPDGETKPKTPVCFPTCDEANPCPSGYMCNPTTGARDVCVKM